MLNRGEQTLRAVTGSGGRLHFGMVAGIKSERRPTSNRNPRPDCLGIRRQARLHLKSIPSWSHEWGPVHFADAKIITLLQDNLNIHAKSSLYEAFPAAEARRLVNRFEWVYTPKHGSWLDLAESELAVLTSQCLDRRIPDHKTLIREVGAWVKHRNLRHAKADWRFTTDDARIKLKHLYPVL